MFVCMFVKGHHTPSDLKQQLVLGEALHWFQKVGVQAQFVLQLLLTLLHKEEKYKDQ